MEKTWAPTWMPLILRLQAQTDLIVELTRQADTSPRRYQPAAPYGKIGATIEWYWTKYLTQDVRTQNALGEL